MEKMNRRSLLKLGLLALGALPFLRRGQNPLMDSAVAAACPAEKPAKIAPEKFASHDKAPGKPQEYVENASDSKNKLYQAGQNCANCTHYKADKAEGGYAPCLMLGLKYVSNCGWCKLYKKKA